MSFWDHVFARQKGQMALLIRRIGIARAEMKITLANTHYNIESLTFHERRANMG